MRVSVLGGGSGGLAFAADLVKREFDVCYWRRNTKALSRIESAGVTLYEAGERTDIQEFAIAGTLEEAVDGAELIICALPAPGLHALAPALAAHLSLDQTLFLAPGALAGLHFRTKEIPVLEAASLPYAARLQDDGAVRIFVRAQCLPVGASRHVDKRDVRRLERVLPCATVTGGLLDPFLINPNFLIHPPRLCCALSSGGTVHLGDTRFANRLTIAMDDERIALRRHMNLPERHFSVSSALMGREHPDHIFALSTLKLMRSLDAPDETIGADHRYLKEDVEFGLALWLKLGERFQTPMPVCRSVLTILQTAHGLRTPDPLRLLGVASVDELLSVLETA